MILNSEIIIFDAEKNNKIDKWHSTNDDVMGGLSNSKMKLDKNGNGVFTGTVSTENNGGFAMVRMPLDINLLDDSKKIVLEITGDGKPYQLRIKSDRSQKHWYIHTFQTSTKFETFEIPLKDLYPSYRGRKLILDNFSSNTIKEIAFLIGNKKNEEYKLTIKKISIN